LPLVRKNTGSLPTEPDTFLNKYIFSDYRVVCCCVVGGGARDQTQGLSCMITVLSLGCILTAQFYQTINVDFFLWAWRGCRGRMSHYCSGKHTVIWTRKVM
jgi:hypothetical protein